MENIFTASKPFINFATFLGLFPMSFEGPARKRILKLSFFGVLLSCCSLLLLVYITVSNLASEDHYSTKASVFFDDTRIFLITAELLSYIFFLINQLCKRKSILRFLELIHEFDVEVNCAGFQ